MFGGEPAQLHAAAANPAALTNRTPSEPMASGKCVGSKKGYHTPIKTARMTATTMR